MSKRCANASKNEVRDLYKMVRKDWHGGYEEQDEELTKHIQWLQKPLTAVIEICTALPKFKAAFDRCNDLLVLIEDTWNDILSIPFRCPPDGCLIEDGGAPMSLVDCGLGSSELDGLR